MSNNQNINTDKFAEIFKALSNPNRLNIYMSLIDCCSPGIKHTYEGVTPETCACVGDLGRELGIVPSTVSHHMKTLRQAGLINMERRGQRIECWVDSDTYDSLKGFFK